MNVSHHGLQTKKAIKSLSGGMNPESSKLKTLNSMQKRFMLKQNTNTCDRHIKN